MKKTTLAILFLVIFCATPAWAQRQRKLLQNPPRLKEIQYHWCQPPTEKQLKQRSKWGMTFDRQIGREEGETRYGNKIGKWTFWDKDGKIMAEGECQAKPAKRDTAEHGTWKYWDTQGRQVTMQWKYGAYAGDWILADETGKQRWHFVLDPENKRREIFADASYLKTNGLWQELPKAHGDHGDDEDHSAPGHKPGSHQKQKPAVKE